MKYGIYTAENTTMKYDIYTADNTTQNTHIDTHVKATDCKILRYGDTF